MGELYDESTKTAQDYYNSEDADNFYSLIWGGEDIHIGLYGKDGAGDIAKASHKTVEYLSTFIHPKEGDVVLDIGAGYGGAMRFLLEKWPLRAMALNLSEKENERNRAINKEKGFDHRIDVIDGSFEAIPLDDDSVDIVWSQDAILHSGNRKKVFQEVNRVLKDGGEFVFTDPMRSDSTGPESLADILERIHLKDLGSPSFYGEQIKALGFSHLSFEDRTYELVNHYSRVLEETVLQYDYIRHKISEDYLTRMQSGLKHWIKGGEAGDLVWGIFYCKK